MQLTAQGIDTLKEITQKVRDYLASLPKIHTEEDKETLLNAIINFRQNIEKEVQMKI